MVGYSNRNAARIRVGISSCLLGEEVRFNGGHKRDRYVTDVLSEHLDLVPVCPEVAIGLGVPRPPIRLLGPPHGSRAVVVELGDRDVTSQLSDYGREVAEGLTDVSGFILKSRSPSCGVEGVEVRDGKGVPAATGRGVFARELIRRRPLLPVEDEGGLGDRGRRSSFLERVFVYHRWLTLAAAGITTERLARFHAEHEFLLTAHDRRAVERLRQTVALAGADRIEQAAADYIFGLLAALRRPAESSSLFAALHRVASHLRDSLQPEERQELQQAIEAYRQDQVPILAPLKLTRLLMRRLPDTHLEGWRRLEGRRRFLEARP